MKPTLMPSNAPTIDIELDKGVSYMVLCWQGKRWDLDEFIFEPGVVYALTDRRSKQESFLLIVGYTLLPFDETKRSIEHNNLQIELVVRTVTDDGHDLIPSPHLTRYPFPACLDHEFSPDRFLIEALEDQAVEPIGQVVPILESPIAIQPTPQIVEPKNRTIDLTHTNLGKPKTTTNQTVMTIVEPKKKAIDLTHTKLGQPKTSTPEKAIQPKLVPVPSLTPDIAQQSPYTEFIVRVDDALRVQNVLQHWVKIANANEHQLWTVSKPSKMTFQIFSGDSLLLAFDRRRRILSTPLTTQQLKDRFEAMAVSIMDCQSDSLPLYETARQIFLRSSSCAQDSLPDFIMHMLSIKKVRSYTKKIA